MGTRPVNPADATRASTFDRFPYPRPRSHAKPAKQRSSPWVARAKAG